MRKYRWVFVYLTILVIVGIYTLVFTTPPVRIEEVQNGDLALRYYYDLRKNSPVLIYFAEMKAGKPTGKLYAVELRGRTDLSRNPIVQFSDAGASDQNVGTLVITVPANSERAAQYHRLFEEVTNKYQTQKWWERVSSFQ